LRNKDKPLKIYVNFKIWQMSTKSKQISHTMPINKQNFEK